MRKIRNHSQGWVPTARIWALAEFVSEGVIKEEVIKEEVSTQHLM